MLRFAAKPLLAVAASLSLSGCYYYGDLAGYDSSYDSSYDPYYSGYGSATFAYSYFGWYQDFYYPGIGVHVFDRYGNRHRWSDRHRRYWEGLGYRHRDRRENWDGFSRGNDGLYRDQRRRDDREWRDGRRGDGRGDATGSDRRGGGGDDWRRDRRGDGSGDGTGSDRRRDGRGDGTGSGRRGGNGATNGATNGGTNGSTATTQPVAPPIMGNRGNRGRQSPNPVVNPSVQVPQVQTQPRVQPTAPPATRAPRTATPPPVAVQPAPAAQPAPSVQRPTLREVRESLRARPSRQDE